MMIDSNILKNLMAKSNESLYSHTYSLIEKAEKLKELGYINNKEFQMTRVSCFYHDMGKANSLFQKRVKNRTRFDKEKEIAHNIISAYLVGLDYNNNEDLTKEDYAIIIEAVSQHHNYVNVKDFTTDESNKNIIETNILDTLDMLNIDKKELSKLKKVYDRISVKDRKRIHKSNTDIIYKFRKINGLLKKCDYAASAHLQIEYKNNFLRNALEELGSTFQTGWNEMQRFCKENKDENLIIKGSTGLGKTEASLLWGDNNKVFYVLPLKTAINSMHKRLKTGLLKDSMINQRLALLHGDTMSAYLLDSGEEKESDFDKVMDYYKLSKNFALPVSITTPDQLFNYVYNYYGSEVIQATLSYSKIIIDEIQAYSADLLCYLIYGLQEAVKMGARYSIITATLPPFVKDLLVKGRDGENLSEIMKYEEREFFNDIDRHNLKILEKELDVKDIVNRYKQSLEEDDSSKFLVVCNTIKKAQRIYSELKKELKDVEINMLHSKFTAKDRAEKEEQIIRDGKTEVNKKVIWISTQVVEASLDIDFDYLFTELSDLNSFFQRLGRVNRKGKKPTENYNSYVYTEIDKKHLRYSDKKGFIDVAIYELSKEVLLREGNGFLSERRKIEMINENFTTEELEKRNSPFLEDYKEHKEFITGIVYDQINKKRAKKLFRNIISYPIIPRHVFESTEEIHIELERLRMIEEEYEILKEFNLSKEERDEKYSELYKNRIESIQKIKGYVVNIGEYDIDEKHDIIESNEIKLSKWDSVHVLDCNYSKEKGFSKLCRPPVEPKNLEVDKADDSNNFY